MIELVARANRVGGDMHLDPGVEQVVHRLADANVGLDPADNHLIASSEIKALCADGREHALLDPRLALEAELWRGVTQTARVLLADEQGHLENARRLHEPRARSRNPRK